MTNIIRIHDFGPSDVLENENLRTPDPGPGEMLVEVMAADVNPVDFKIRKGEYPRVSRDQLPFPMGRDVSGVVVAAGDDTRFEVGSDIFAMLGEGRGGYADQVIVQSGEAAAKPQTLSHADAAAVPLAGLTAWQGLIDQGGLESGQTVLIHGGAGGVGHFAVQIAKARGAEVYTTAKAQDRQFLEDIGADHIIDYENERFEDALAGVDLVFDLIGGETQERSWTVLKAGGAMVSTLQPPSEERAREKNARATAFLVQPNGVQLEEMAQLIEQGRIKPFVSDVLPLAEAAKAQDQLEQTHSQGKVVLQVA